MMIIRDFRTRAQKFEKDSPVMAESERLKQRQSLAETERDIARRQRALIEERNQRANEESQIILARANKIIQDIAKKHINLYVIDAIHIAGKLGLKGRTNTILQSAFFRVNPQILPA